MPFKLPSVSSRVFSSAFTALLAGLTGAVAQAAPTVEPFLPHSFDSTSGTSTIYYVHSGIALNADQAIDPEMGAADLTVPGGYVYYYRLSNLDPNQLYVYVYAEGDDDDTNYPIPVSVCTNGATCTTLGVGQNHTRIDTNGAVEVDIGLNFAQICAATSSANAAEGCAGNTFDVVSATPPGLKLKVLQTTTDTAPTDAATINGGTTFRVIPETAAPTILSSCPSLSEWFFPGDGAIFAETGTLIGQKATTGSGSSRFDKFIVAAQRDTLGGFPANPFLVQNDATNGDPAVVGRQAYNSGSQEFLGFNNSTNDVPRRYEAKIGIRDTAGVAVFCPGTFTIFASDIRSFLDESNCFVATASFRSGRAAPVMMLRAFRDQVLTRSELGRKFVSFYYKEGPKAAEWLLQNPEFRIPALQLLIPVQVLAWIALHPDVLWIPVLLFLGFIFFVPRSRGALRRNVTASLVGIALIVAVGGSRDANAANSPQPYIDSLLSEIDASKEPVRTHENPDPYIESVKKTLPPSSGTAQGYTEDEKQALGPGADSRDYTEKLKRQIGKKPGGDSAIADFRSGRELKPNKGPGRSTGAFAFKVSTAMNRTYDAGSAEDLSYEEVYGDGYVPEFTISYEYRPFEAPVLRNLGILGSFGGSFKQANGTFAYNEAAAYGRAKAKFRFIVLPASVGPIFRFSLFDFLYPYAGAGGSVVGFLENRTDDKESMRGYSFGTWGVLGVSFGLDWISPKSSWDQYVSTGVRHTYLSIEYSYLATYGGLIEATVDGIQAGLTFEF